MLPVRSRQEHIPDFQSHLPCTWHCKQQAPESCGLKLNSFPERDFNLLSNYVTSK